MEQHSQPLARSFDPHFQGGDSNSRDRRHVFVSHVFNVLQQKRFPLIHVQSLQSALEFFTPRRAFGRVLFGGSVKRDFVVDERALPSTPPSSGGPAAIGKNAKEPGSESLRVIALRQRSIGTDKRILQRLFRVLPTPEHSYGVPPVLCPVSRHNHGVCLGFSGQDTSHNCGITVVLNRETPRLRHPST
jgi:hypothetical protein